MRGINHAANPSNIPLARRLARPPSKGDRRKKRTVADGLGVQLETWAEA